VSVTSTVSHMTLDRNWIWLVETCFCPVVVVVVVVVVIIVVVLNRCLIDGRLIIYYFSH
jgi:hypothetical protein